MKRLFYFAGAVCLILVTALEIWRQKAPTLRDTLLVEHPITEDTLKIMAIGDFGTGKKEQRLVAQQMEATCIQEQTQAILLLGDNIYPKGVTSTSDPNWEAKIESVLRSPCLSQLKRYALLGNHDYYGKPEAQIDYSYQSSTWVMPNRFYQVDFGPLLRLVIVDTNIADVCLFDNRCSLSFARHAIEQSKAEWTISAGHHPISSAKSKHKTPPVMAWFMKRSLCNSDLYLSGHKRQRKTCPLKPLTSLNKNTRILSGDHKVFHPRI